MKKLCIFFSIVCLTIGIVACSNDDNTVELTAEKELFLQVDKGMVHENEEVLFSAFDDKNKEVKADFYLDGIKITNKHLFPKKGVYFVVAKKEGFIDSSPLTIEVVKESEVVLKTLVLSASKHEVIPGESVDFNVTNGSTEMENVNIRFIGTDTYVSGNSWEPNAMGVYKFVASKLGYFDSNEITVTVKQRDFEDKRNITVQRLKYNVDLIGLCVKGDLETSQPILFKNGDLYYFMYVMKYITEDGEYAIEYLMKVYVPKDVKKLILPYEVDKSKVEPFAVINSLEGAQDKRYSKNEFKVDKMEWEKPIKDIQPGRIKTQLETLDEENAVDYEGIYDELYLDAYKPEVDGRKVNIQKIEPNRGSIKIVEI